MVTDTLYEKPGIMVVGMVEPTTWALFAAWANPGSNTTAVASTTQVRMVANWSALIPMTPLHLTWALNIPADDSVRSCS